MTTGDRGGRELTEACRRELSGWAPPTPAQDQLRRHYLKHLRVRADGWARASPGEHLTASALVCAPEERLVLLTLHAKIKRWLQTGGHLEAHDRSLPEAALREAGEESGLPGLRVDPVPLLLSRHQVSCGGEPTFHLDVQYLVRASVNVPPVVTAESLAVSWFGWRALPDVDDSVRALVAAAACRLGWHPPARS